MRAHRGGLPRDSAGRLALVAILSGVEAFIDPGPIRDAAI
jgi:hypothetical protein